MAIEFGLDDGLKIPPRSEVGYLSSEIANEGFKVSEGVKEQWTPPQGPPMTPDWSQFKSITKYFNRKGFEPWPSWIYHPTEPARIVKDAEEARHYGVIFREATQREISMGQPLPRYDIIGDTDWRTQPYANTRKFDPRNPGSGKNYETPRPDYQQIQADQLGNLVRALKEGGVKGGSGLDAEAIAAIVAATVKAMSPAPAVQPMAAAEEDERAAWLREAEGRGVKVDKRWGVERIKAEIEKQSE